MDARDRSPVISQPFLSFLLFYIKHISFIYIICFIIDTSLCCCCLFLFRQSIFSFFLLIRTGTLFFFFPSFCCCTWWEAPLFLFTFTNLSCPCSLLLIQSCCMRPNAQLFSSFLKLEKLQRDEREIRECVKCCTRRSNAPTHTLYTCYCYSKK